MKQIQCYKPDEIEKKSFEIIDDELKKRGIILPGEQEMVIKRVIHATADFTYADTLLFSEGAVEAARKLFLGGADLVTDTNMALAGISRKTLARFGGKAHCFMADAQAARLAEERRVTRASISMEFAAGLKKPAVIAVGNAPTALIRLYEMIQEGVYIPAFIIGVPVGFVNVEAAKELILQTDVPYIVNRGRKGGSSVAAAICNAILYTLA